MEVGGGQHLPQPSQRLGVDEADVGEPGAGRLQTGPGRAASVDHEDDVGPLLLQAAGGIEEQIEGLGEADVAGVHHHPASHEAMGGPVVVLGGAHRNGGGVDEVGDHPHLGRLPPPGSLAPTLAARSSDSTVTASARR